MGIQNSAKEVVGLSLLPNTNTNINTNTKDAKEIVGLSLLPNTNTNINTNKKGAKEIVGLSLLPRPDGFSQNSGENHSAALDPPSQLQFPRKIISFSSQKIKYSWGVREIQLTNNTHPTQIRNSHERLFPFPLPCFTSYFLFLPDPWYLLQCRWMDGNSDGSVIETYSLDGGAVGGVRRWQ